MARPDRFTREQRRQVRELVAKFTPQIRAAFEATIQNARANLDFAALVSALDAGDLYRANAMLTISQAQLFPFEEAIRTAIIGSGISVASLRTTQGTFGFNGRHPRAEALIAEMGAKMVTQIGNPGVEVIRAVLLQGQTEGVGVQKVARRLAGTSNPRTGIREGGIIGLDGPRADRSRRVREILNDPEQIARYFKGKDPRYTRTDRRFDKQVRAAIAEGRALDKATIEKIAKAHDARLLLDRGKTIAAHEAFTAQAQGRNEAYLQLMESGKVESITKRWDHNTLKQPRTDHKALDGTEVALDKGFAMADGAVLQYPHDPSAGPNHTLKCRCSVVYIPQFKRPVQ